MSFAGAIAGVGDRAHEENLLTLQREHEARTNMVNMALKSLETLPEQLHGPIMQELVNFTSDPHYKADKFAKKMGQFWTTPVQTQTQTQTPTLPQPPAGAPVPGASLQTMGPQVNMEAAQAAGMIPQVAPPPPSGGEGPLAAPIPPPPGPPIGAAGPMAGQPTPIPAPPETMVRGTTMQTMSPQAARRQELLQQAEAEKEAQNRIDLPPVPGVLPEGFRGDARVLPLIMEGARLKEAAKQKLEELRVRQEEAKANRESREITAAESRDSRESIAKEAHETRAQIAGALAATHGAAQAQAATMKSYQFHSSQLTRLQQPVDQTVFRLDRLQETMNQKTPQADALVAPELLTVMAGGQGSGLRMNEAEIARIVGGRSQWESLKASINKWKTDPEAARSITKAQEQQIQNLLKAVSTRLYAKQNALNEAGDALAVADSPQGHRTILQNARKALSGIDQGRDSGTGTIHFTGANGKAWDVPAAEAYAFRIAHPEAKEGR